MRTTIKILKIIRAEKAGISYGDLTRSVVGILPRTQPITRKTYDTSTTLPSTQRTKHGTEDDKINYKISGYITYLLVKGWIRRRQRGIYKITDGGEYILDAVDKYRRY